MVTIGRSFFGTLGVVRMLVLVSCGRLECDRAIERRLTDEFEKGKAQQTGEQADQHSPHQQDADHRDLAVWLVTGKAEQVPPVMHELVHIGTRQ